jgi:subtilisin family serine protease
LGGVGNAGAGVKIGILDTGIDQNHAAFQDNALAVPAGFPKCQGSDCSFTNHKVIVARSYVSILTAGSGINPAATSSPDDVSPRDRIGHGTALAMCSAGETNTGPSDTITGMAPKAWLGNYKVFGSPGINDFTGAEVFAPALDDAIADGMDIVVMSFGQPAFSGATDQGAVCGAQPGQACDPGVQAVQNAVGAGLTVVIAAGNDGTSGNLSATGIPTLGVVTSPGIAPSAITAGATTNSHAFYVSVEVKAAGAPANLQRLNADFGDGPQPPAPVTGARHRSGT